MGHGQRHFKVLHSKTSQTSGGMVKIRRTSPSASTEPPPPHQSSHRHWLPQTLVLEKQIGTVQESMSQSLTLRAGKRWREQGEFSAGSLKRTVEPTEQRRRLPPLLHPITDVICNDNEALQQAIHCFYSTLYRPEPIDQPSVAQMLDALSPSNVLSSDDQDHLKQPFILAELLASASRCPRISSPRMDGLPYNIVRLIIRNPLCKTLALKVYTNALRLAQFPSSWTATAMCLLPKKGDLSRLSNWRPRLLISSDAKIFTRLLNDRFVRTVSALSHPLQTGFMPQRFIADNRLMVRLIKDDAYNTPSSGVGLHD